MHEKIAEKCAIKLDKGTYDGGCGSNVDYFLTAIQSAINEATEAQQKIVTTIEVRQKASGKREQAHQKRIAELESLIRVLYHHVSYAGRKSSILTTKTAMDRIDILGIIPTEPQKNRPDSHQGGSQTTPEDKES